MTLSLPKGQFKAFLFDCDGTIADSLPIHYQAWLEALAEWKCEFPEELFYAWGGIPVPKTVDLLNERFHLNMPVDQVVERREKAYLSALEKIKPVASVVEQIDQQYGKIPLAVVSGSPRASVVRTLTFLGLLDRFHTIVGAEDYTHGKPHPEPYLLAASKVGVPPEFCLVFEDSEPGIQSAQAAGMGYVKVPNRGPLGSV